jgi:hypothetical protein
MDGSHSDRSFADRTGNPFGGAVANVTGGEDAWSAGLEGIRLTLNQWVTSGSGFRLPSRRAHQEVEAPNGPSTGCSPP